MGGTDSGDFYAQSWDEVRKGSVRADCGRVLGRRGA